MEVLKMEENKEIKGGKKKSRLKRIFLIFLLVFLVCGLLIGIYFYHSLTPVDKKMSETREFVVQSGWGKSRIADELEKSGFIRNSFVFKVYVKLSASKTFFSGTYSLSPSMSASEIIKVITSGNSKENLQKTVTFVEGKRFTYYVKKLCDELGFKESDVYTVTSNEAYLKGLIQKYWFIKEDILNKDLYYPLEGYLFPDTYSFKQSSTIEEAIDVMLSGMDAKLSIYKEEINMSEYSIHGLLTLASMVELEAVTAEDRATVAGIFINRLHSNIPLGSDVTTYYAVKKEMVESLSDGDLNQCSAYNTRGTCAIKGLPVGPVCASSYSSIVAAIEPEKNDYYFFVADIHNKIYPTKNSTEHAEIIEELKRKNIWPK